MSQTISDPNALYSPTDFQINALTYTNSQNVQIDLRRIYTSIDLFYDIFSNFTSGNVVLEDSTNIFGHIVSQGFEFLRVSITKPGMNIPFNETFRITSRNAMIAKDNKHMIKIQFCSEELMLSKATKFTKSYNGMLVSDMAKDIGRNILKIPATNFPDNSIETTTNINSITIPNFNPFQALNWLASRATSSYVGATFLFFKTKVNYNFKSLQSLMDVSSPKATYNVNVKNITSTDPNLDFYDISKYQILKLPDTLHSLMNGKFSARLMTLDPLRQKFTTLDLNGDDLYNASVTLGNAKQYNNFEDRLGNQMNSTYASYRSFFPTNKGQDTAPYIQGKQQVNQNNVESWLLERNAMIQQLLSIRVKAIIPGNPSIDIGDVIQLNMPSNEPQVGQDEGSLVRKLDPYYSGNYIITAMRHHFDIKHYECVVELSKDSLNQQLPSALNTNSNLGTLA